MIWERDFGNVDVNLLYESKGISHEYSTPRIPQQNGVTERKNNVTRDG